MNGLDVIDTYMVEKSSDPVSNETMAPVIPKVSYQNGALRFEHLAGYQIYLMQINGKMLERFVIQVREELHPNISSIRELSTDRRKGWR